MRVALLPDDYLPNSTRVHAKMFHELALELKSRGHEPIIITPGEPNQHSTLVINTIDDIEIWRFKSGRTRDVGRVKRALNESLLSIRAWLAIRRKVKSMPFDLCINYSPTIFFGLLAKKIQKHGAYVYLILRDMFPQWVIDEGLIKEGSPIARYFRFFERLNYKTSDCIGLMSQANLILFHKLHPGYPNAQILMNWANTEPLQTQSEKNWREEWQLHGKLVFFYGGNIGHAQDMTNLMRLARGMLDIPEAHFLFVGQGDEFDIIQQLKNDWLLTNVTIKPSVSQSIYRELLTQVDIGLFSLSAKHSAHNFPGKLLGYMVESLPIIGSVNLGNDVIELINENDAGSVFVNGEDELLLAASRRLFESSQLRQVKGANSRMLLERYFSVESAVDTILSATKQGLPK